MALEELLVVFACLNSTGCKETSNAYYSTHPELKQLVKKHEIKVRKLFGPYVIETAGPLLYVVSGGTGTVRLSQQFSVQISKENFVLSFRKDF
jgi:hypothetical protein